VKKAKLLGTVSQAERSTEPVVQDREPSQVPVSLHRPATATREA